ncbi:PAS domain-containing protein [Mesonia maritima]|uniref:PAS domain-containing protein n=1 Tax=Mesonia maritima TaxID=1793873 RepID=UPI0036411D5F
MLDFKKLNGVAIPISISNKVIGELLLFTKIEQIKLKQFSQLLKGINEEVAIIIERKKKEEELNTFFNISNDLLCIAGLDGYFKKINPAFTKNLGYSEEEILSIPFEELVHPEDVKLLHNEMASLAKGIPIFQNEFRYIHKNGNIIWLSWTASSEPEEGLIYAIGKNITATKKAEFNLRDLNKKLKEAQNIAKLGYWKRQLSNEVSFWSDEVYKIYEQDPDKFTPSFEHLIKTFHPEEQYLLKEKFSEILIENEYKDFEHRIITPKGKTKWVWQRIKLETDKNGNPTTLRGIIQDITVAKEKDIQIKSSHERFELAMKATNELIWDWDTETDVVTRSKGYSTIFGYKKTRTTSVQGFWFKKIHHLDRQRVKHDLFVTLANKNNNKWESEYRFIKANGEIAHVQDSGYIIRNANGKAVRVVGAVKDITASKRMVREITKQNEILKEIAWIQSHKVRAPLAKILSLTEILTHNDYKDSNLTEKELYSFIAESAYELDQVIKEIVLKTETIQKHSL